MNKIWNCEPVTERKMRRFAESLPDDVDFADYWYNFAVSKTKEEIDGSIINNINAFHWTRWKEDFEVYVDGYTPIKGNGLHDHWRGWFAAYTQPFIDVFDLPAREIFTFYGKEKFTKMLDMYPRAHCYGVDCFIDDVIDEFGAPAIRRPRYVRSP